MSYLLSKRVDVSAYHTRIISGQLGLKDVDIRVVPVIKSKQVSYEYFHTILIDLENNVWVFGNNDNGQLGLGSDRYQPTLLPIIKVSQISTRFNYDLWCCGNNINGQLGLGSTQRIYLKSIQIAAGFNYTLMNGTSLI